MTRIEARHPGRGAREQQVSELVAALSEPPAFAGVFGAPAPGAIPLLGGNPASEGLPIDLLRQAVDRVLSAKASAQGALRYSRPQGIPELRAFLAQREGVDVDRVVITNGALHSLQLPVLAVVNPSDAVVVDNPIYPNTLRVLQLASPQVVPIDVGHDGLDVDDLAGRLRDGLRPALVYTVADFHNPSGVVLSAPARRRLVELAEHYGFVVLWDNPYRSSRFAGEEVPNVDLTSDWVVSASTFSKSLGPGLRLGWLVLPPWLVAPVLKLRARTDQHPSTFTQAIVASVVSEPGAFDHVLSTLRVLHRERAERLVAELGSQLGALIEANRPDGGFFVWARLTDRRFDAASLQAAAVRAGTAFALGSSFDSSGTGRFGDRLRLGFSDTGPEDLATAVARLARAADSLASAGTRPGSSA